MKTITLNLRSAGTQCKTTRDNDIFMNGFAYGKREGATALIQMLQADINDNGGMTDIDEIKMYIFNAWKAICIDQTNFAITNENAEKE